MKGKISLASLLMMLVCIIGLSSCSDDEVSFVPKGVCGSYEYHITGIVAIEGESTELPAESGTMQIGESDEGEWNLRIIMTTSDGNCYTAEGSCEDKSFVALSHCTSNITIADETYRTAVSGQGSFDKEGNMELTLSLLGQGIKSKGKLVNEQVRLIAIRK